MRRVFLVSPILLAACSTTHAVPPDFAPRAVREVRRWRLRAAERKVGALVLLEMADPAGPARFYRVENVGGQWLGFVDLQGRVYQRVPFSMQEEFRGIHTMQEALAILLEEPGPFVWSSRGEERASEASGHPDKMQHPIPGKNK